MTTPEGTTASPPPANPRLLNLVQGKPLTARRAARIIASVTLSITIISGVLMHFTDEKTYPTIGDGLWWAIQTVTTVGYGDLVPASTVGRLVAALVMVVGIGFLTVVTAAITSAFIESARRRIGSTRPDALSEKLDQIGARLGVIEAALKDIGARDRDARPWHLDPPGGSRQARRPTTALAGLGGPHGRPLSDHAV